MHRHSEKARVLLKAAVSEAGEGWSDERIAEALQTSLGAVERTRRQLVEESFEARLVRKYNPNTARPRIFDGVAEAKLIALTCSRRLRAIVRRAAPEGSARWTLSLLEEKGVALNIVAKASDNTIRRTLKKHLPAASQVAMGDSAGSQRRLRRQQGGRAGDLAKPRDPKSPLVRLDEASKQMIREKRAPINAAPGRKRRENYAYKRNGVANLFMLFAPLEGWRHVEVTDRHAAVDYAQVLKFLSDTRFPDAEKIVLAGESQHPQTGFALRGFSRRLGERFGWRYTPKQGSWLDIAESELGVLTSQCLDCRCSHEIEEVPFR